MLPSRKNVLDVAAFTVVNERMLSSRRCVSFEYPRRFIQRLLRPATGMLPSETGSREALEFALTSAGTGPPHQGADSHFGGNGFSATVTESGNADRDF